MKKKYGNKTGKVNKGAPSGFIISLLFHAAVFAVAGVFVVFTMVRTPPPVFVAEPPPPRPKMSLKKPIVKIKKSSSPKPASRIVAKVKMAKMPEISIPDLTGTGDSLMSGMGGFGGNAFGMPGPGGTLLFGDTITTGMDMEVTFYSFSRSVTGGTKSMEHKEYYNLIREFVAKDWETTLFRRYYRAPRKLYAKCIAIPIVSSIVGPLSFGEDDYINNARCWAAHYRATLCHKDGITFRFWGAADDVLTVGLDREVVLAANFPWNGVDGYTIAEDFNTQKAPGSRSSQVENDGAYPVGCSLNAPTLVGSGWITLEPGKKYQFDAITGEGPGGEYFAELMVEVQGVDYKNNDRGNPIFPLFATQRLTWEEQDSILLNMARDEANVTNITTFFIQE